MTIMLEELLALGHAGAEYDAWLIKIGKGDQFGSGFVAMNPNSKIPVLVDRSGPTPIRVFESGSILVYLAEKFGALPADGGRATRGMPFLALLADGQRALSWRRLRPFLRVCADEDRICDRSLRDGGEASARRARPAAGRNRVSRATPTRSPIWLSSPGTAGWRRVGCTARRVPERRGIQERQRWADILLERPAVKRGRMVNRTWASPRASCASATRRATSRRRRRTRSQRRAN